MTILPGIVVSLIVALVAMGIETLLNIDFISATVIAIFLGMIVNTFISLPESTKPGITFSAKRLLKGFIVLLGASMNLTLIVDIGGQTLLLLLFTISTAYLTSWLCQKVFHTETELTTLFAVGTSICGGSAISAVSPVIHAKEKVIAYAVSSVFLIDMFLILIMPLAAQALGLSDLAVGLWSGTAINDTSSVVAASFSFSEAAGQLATMVKMTRTLAIIPTVLFFANKHNDTVDSKRIQSIFPWFIVGFLALAVLNTVGLIPSALGEWLDSFRKLLMVTALAGIGLKTDISAIKLLGIKPFIHVLCVSMSVIAVSLLVIQLIL